MPVVAGSMTSCMTPAMALQSAPTCQTGYGVDEDSAAPALLRQETGPRSSPTPAPRSPSSTASSITPTSSRLKGVAFAGGSPSRIRAPGAPSRSPEFAGRNFRTSSSPPTASRWGAATGACWRSRGARSRGRARGPLRSAPECAASSRSRRWCWLLLHRKVARAR